MSILTTIMNLLFPQQMLIFWLVGGAVAISLGFVLQHIFKKHENLHNDIKR